MACRAAGDGDPARADAAPPNVVLTYACAPSEAGWTVEVRANGVPAARGSLMSTGSWTDYGTRLIGTLALAPGEHRITVHGDKDQGPLMKLRRLELRPRN